MKTIVMIDGGYLRASARKAGLNYDNRLIEKFAAQFSSDTEYLLRVLYYDAAKYRGKLKKPVSGEELELGERDWWLDDLAQLPRFAVRRGTIGFRGWKLRNEQVGSSPLTDDDFAPVFEQKGVDMRIGLDIAICAERRTADRIILVSGDTDMVPAMKHARKAGIEIVVVRLPQPAHDLHPLVLSHADTVRVVQWPK